MNKKYGFTLIELLVVIAIIAILAAILFPVFAQAREKARQISCASNLKQLSLSCLMYTEDYDETFPIGNSLWAQQPSGTITFGDTSQMWPVEVLPYVKSAGVFVCPDDPAAGTSDWRGERISYAANGLQTLYTGAAGNDCLGVMCQGATSSHGGPGNDSFPIVAIGKVNEPDSVIMLCEMHSYDLRNFSLFGPNNNNGNFSAWTGNVITGDPYYNAFFAPDQCGAGGGAFCPIGVDPDTVNGAVIPDHAGNTLSNFAFCDGHVKALMPLATTPDPYISGVSAGSNPFTGCSGGWWCNGIYDTGPGTNRASMWVANHN